jgi:hypothetical protein
MDPNRDRDMSSYDLDIHDDRMWFLSFPPSDSGKLKWVVHLETEIRVDQVAWRESPIHSISYRRKPYERLVAAWGPEGGPRASVWAN